MLTFKKPHYWNKLAFYEKIRYYGNILSKEYSDYVDKLKSKEIVKKICGDLIQVSIVIKILKNVYSKFDSLNPIPTDTQP